ncbi:MAG: sugar-transfer associated ATP-grasp domain-containing protein [Mesorhizobium sp.]
MSIARRWWAYRCYLKAEFEDAAPSAMWRLHGLLRGHQSKALVMLEDQAFRRRDYIPFTLLTRRVATYNRRIDRVLFNKLSQKVWLDRVKPSVAPPMTHYVAGRHLIDLSRPDDRLGLEAILPLVRQRGELFLKPSGEGQARGALRLADTPGGLQVNGREMDPREWLDDFARQRTTGYTVSDIIRQGSWSEAFFPPTLNTLRVLTGTHFSNHEPVILAATMKMGRPATYPTDNWRVGRGGISALVDPVTGILGPGLSYNAVTKRRHISELHPETSAQIRGAAIPNWDLVRSRMLQLAALLPYPGVIGWDVALTGDDIVIVEANTYPGMAIHESHASLKRTAEQRAFWAEMRI